MPHRSRLALLLALLVFPTCSPDYTLPDGAVVECVSNDECPPGYFCFGGQCGLSAPATPPSLVVGTIARSVDTVALPLTAVDSDGEDATLVVEVSPVDDASPEARSWTAISVTPATVPTTPSGTATTVAWDAASFFGDSTFRTLVVQAAGEDSNGRGSLVESAPFSFGNSAPSLALGTGLVARLSNPQSGDLLLPFTVADAEGDPVDAVFEFRVQGTTDWVPMSLSLGATTSLESTSTVERIVVWDTLDATGGVGTASATVELRARVFDTVGGVETYGEDVLFGPVTIDNVSAPLITDLRAPRVEVAAGQAPVAIHYEVRDAESSQVDVRFEYSVDGGLVFHPCREFGSAVSEGTHSLATHPGGLDHVYVWDPAGISISPRGVTLRLTVSETTTPANASQRVLGLSNPLVIHGADGGEAPFVLHQDDGSIGAEYQLLHGDFDEDGRIDLLAGGSSGASGEANFHLNLLRGDATTPTFGAATPVIVDHLMRLPNNDTCEVSGVGDFDADGHLDVAAAVTAWDGANPASGAEGFSVWFGDGAGGFTSVEHTTTARVAAFVTADVDGDGQHELAAFEGNTLRVYAVAASPAARTITKTAEVTLSQSVVCHAAVGDFNGDSFDDLAVRGGDVLLADGSGGLALETHSALADVTSSGGTRGTDLASGDFNNDGFDDLLVSSTRPVGFLSFFGAADPATRFARSAFALKPSNRGKQPSVADFNGDGVLDFVDPLNLLVYVGSLETDGTSSFSLDVVLSADEALGNPSARTTTAADLDGDDVAELIADQGLRVLSINNARRGIRAAGAAALNRPVTPNLTTLTLGDFDRDGLADVWLGTDRIYWGQGLGLTGDGTFSDETQLADPTALQPVPMDLDGDGVDEWVGVTDTSLVQFGPTSADRRTLGRLAESPFTTTVGSAARLMAADVDGDGDEDLVVQESGGAIRTHFHQGGFVFDEPVFHSGDNPRDTLALVPIDPNNDGRVGFVAGKALTSSRVGIWDSVGNGEFTPVATALDIPRRGPHLVEDFDSDGLQDFLVPGTVAGSCGLAWLASGTSYTPTTGRYWLTNDAVFAVHRDGTSGWTTQVLVDGLWTMPSPVSGGRPTAEMVRADGTFSGNGCLGDLDYTRRRETLPSNGHSVAGDLNRDGVNDLVSVDPATGVLGTFVGQDVRASASHRVRAKAGPLDTPGLVVSGLTSPGGDAPETRIAWRPETDVAGRQSFDSLRRRNSPLAGRDLVPLSAPWVLSGLRRLRRTDGAGTAGGPRLRVEAELEGFDLSATPPRGVVIELPLFADQTRAGLTGTVRVLRRQPRWTRAADFSDDVAAGSITDPELLPRASSGGELRDVVEETNVWTEISTVSTADFSTGTGERLFVAGADGALVVRVLVEEDGVYQALLEP